MAGDIYEMFMLGDGVDAQARQRALAEALKAKIQGQQQQANFDRAWGGLGLMGGTDMMQRMGQAQLGEARHQDALAHQGEQGMAGVGEFKAGSALKRAMAARQFAQEKELLGLKAEQEKTKRGFDAEEGLRKELMGNPVTKATQEVATAFGRVQNAAADPSPAGDIALVYGFMKMMDPGSTVREGEFATAQNAGGVPQQIVSMYNKALNGQRLAPEIRADFLKKSKGLYDVQVGRYGALEKSYRGLAEGSGANPDRVAIPLGFDAGQQQGGAPTAPPRQEVRDRNGRLLGYINADGTEELVP